VDAGSGCVGAAPRLIGRHRQRWQSGANPRTAKRVWNCRN
jgi:hypothetical protein